MYVWDRLIWQPKWLQLDTNRLFHSRMPYIGLSIDVTVYSGPAKSLRHGGNWYTHPRGGAHRHFSYNRAGEQVAECPAPACEQSASCLGSKPRPKCFVWQEKFPERQMLGLGSTLHLLSWPHTSTWTAFSFFTSHRSGGGIISILRFGSDDWYDWFPIATEKDRSDVVQYLAAPCLRIWFASGCQQCMQ